MRWQKFGQKKSKGEDMIQTIISVFVFFLILTIIVLAINKLFIVQKTTTSKPYDRAVKEIIALSKDPSQRKSYDPDWVLRHLL
jgi:transcription termination factor NusB